MCEFPSTIFNLADKDIWVVGGAGYLGQATVKLLRKAGAKVLCIDLGTRAEIFIKSCNLEPDVTPATLDVFDSKAIKQFVVEQIKVSGVPYGLVNLTVATTAKNMEDLTDDDFDKVNHGNLTSTFILTREIGLEMAKIGKGSLVLFSSMYGLLSPDPQVYEPPMSKNPIEYGVNKAGVIQMTRYLAVHWGKNNVRCNCISPGAFPNPMVQKEHPQFIERLSQKSPLGRVGKSEEIAGVVVFLLSDAASYITGQNLLVDGGWSIW